LAGAAIGVAPEATFGLVERLIRPGDSSLECYGVRCSYHRPGENETHLECVHPDGGREVVVWQAIARVLGLAFLAVFVPVFLVVYLLLSSAAVLVARGLQCRASAGDPWGPHRPALS
jgi:hypothetical protein